LTTHERNRGHDPDPAPEAIMEQPLLLVVQALPWPCDCGGEKNLVLIGITTPRDPVASEAMDCDGKQRTTAVAVEMQGAAPRPDWAILQ
jgi:hypothetical protein